jgi:hypothetical protein
MSWGLAIAVPYSTKRGFQDELWCPPHPPFALGACKALPGSGSNSSSTATATPSSSESEKTRKIEEKAAEIQRHEEDLKNMTGTDQEKIDAANKIDQERRELQEMQESNGSS